MTQLNDIKTPKPGIEFTGTQGSGMLGVAPWASMVDGGIVTSAGSLGLFGSAYCGGYALGGAAAALVGTDALSGKNRYTLGGGPIYGSGLSGYSQPWAGTYPVYRIMISNPTLALALSVVTDAVMKTGWSFEQSDDAPEGAKDVIQKAIERILTQLILDCLRALIMGWSGFEILWETRDGYLLPARLKYLIPDNTEILVTDKGGFAGLKQGNVKIGPGKAIVFTLDKEGDNYYGRSRLENCRRDWSNYHEDDDNLSRLGKKASSIIAQIGYPAGTGIDEGGRLRTNYDIAVSIAQGMASGQPVVYSNLAGLDQSDLRNIGELAGKSMWSFGTIDMGSAGPSQDALLRVLAYRDVRLVRGFLLPERTVLEAQRGGLGQSDSAAHGDIGLSNADRVLSSIIQFANEIGDLILLWNFGPNAVGKVQAKAAPRDAGKIDFLRKLLATVVANPQAIGQVLRNVDADNLFDQTGVPKKSQTVDFDIKALTPAPPAAKPDPSDPNQPSNPKQANDNGQEKQPTV